MSQARKFVSSVRGARLALALACGCGAPADSGDPEDLCSGTEALNYDTFGAGFLSVYCQGCHASTATDRYGAPESVTFDDRAQAMAQLGAIRATVLGSPASMPPGGGVPARDLERLELWLACEAGGAR